MLLTLRVVSFGALRARYPLHAQYVAVTSGYFVFLSGVAVIANYRRLQTNNAKRGTSDKLARRARDSHRLHRVHLFLWITGCDAVEEGSGHHEQRNRGYTPRHSSYQLSSLE